MNIPKFDIEQIARMLNLRKNVGGPPTVLFLGSRTGSLFRRPGLADQLQSFGQRALSNMSPVERFHECYKILEELKGLNLDGDIHAIVRKALQERQVEVADLRVVELMKQGIFNYIITTNIGNELERAFRQNNMEDPYDFEVIIPGSGGSIANRLHKGSTFKILKASGDLIAKRYSICGYNIDSREIFLDKYIEISTYLKQLENEEMVMVGFDYKWDRHLIRAIFPRRTGSLWYVNEEQTREDSFLFSYLQDYGAKCLEGTAGGYEPFFVNLCKALGIVPTNLTTQITQHEQEEEVKISSSNHGHQPPPVGGEQDQPEQPPPSKPEQQRDFFVSYNSHDRQWAEWIAWQLEEAGYSVFIQAWDFLSGGNFVLDMQKAITQSTRTIAVLSKDYLQAPFPQSEWAAAFAQDPTSEHQTLLPVRVRECKPTGLWASIVYIDLVGLTESTARERLLNSVGGVMQQRNKPDSPPPFPSNPQGLA